MANEIDPTVNEIDDSQNVEDVVVEEAVVEEAVESDAPTLEDYRDLEKKNKELYERTKKAEGAAKVLKTKAPELNSTETTGLSREEAILFAKGYTEDEVNLAKKISVTEGAGLLVVAETDDYFKSKVSTRQKKEKSEKASLPASSGSALIRPSKPITEMDDDEHQELFHETMKNV